MPFSFSSRLGRRIHCLWSWTATVHLCWTLEELRLPFSYRVLPAQLLGRLCDGLDSNPSFNHYQYCSKVCFVSLMRNFKPTHQFVLTLAFLFGQTISMIALSPDWFSGKQAFQRKASLKELQGSSTSFVKCGASSERRARNESSLITNIGASLRQCRPRSRSSPYRMRIVKPNVPCLPHNRLNNGHIVFVWGAA